MTELRITKKAQLTGHKASIFALSPGKAAPYFLSGGGEGWIVEWNLEDPELGKLIAKAESNIYALQYFAEKELIVAGNMHGGVHWIDLLNPDNNKNIQHHKKGVYGFKKVDNDLISLGGEGMLTKWSIDERRTLDSLHLTNQSLRAIDYNPDRNELAIGASDHHIYLLDADTWQVKQIIRNAHANSVFAIRYAPNAPYLWSGGRDAHLKVWHLDKDYKTMFNEPAHWFTINSLAFQPDGNLLATGSRDKTIKIWDCNTFQLLKVLEPGRDGGHINSVNALYWSNYNNYLISCSDDRSLIIWQVEV